MKIRALLVAALVISFGAASAAPKYFGAAATLAVRAGVGGMARPGRWLPVDVTVTAGDAAIRGAVVAEWGGAIARRDVDLAPSASARVTLLIRTIAASPTVRVSLVGADGRAAANSEISLTLLPVDDPVTLCVGADRPAAHCAATIPPAEVPTAWRAFDLADHVDWNATEPPAGEAARAYALWQAARWWQDSGFVDPVIAPFDARSRLFDRTSASLMAFVAALVLVSGLMLLRRAPVVLIAAFPIAAAAGGVALVTRSSRDVDIQAASFVHQFAGVPRAIVVMKGDVEHPGAHALELVPEVDAASLDIVRGLQQTESTASRDDRAVYRNTAGRGVKQRFELNGTLDAEWLSVTDEAGEIRATNRSDLSMTECQLRAGGDPVPVGSIAPGETARVALSHPLADGDALVCRLPADWMKWTAPGTTIATRGTAFLIFHAWSNAAR